MQRYFVAKDNIKYPYVFINGDDCHHISNVMRMKINDMVYISDQINSYIAKIISISKDEVKLEIDETLNENKELPYNVTIAHGLVRREKMEEVIDYITELGANSYQPIVMERSIVKVNTEQFDKKMDRLNRIAKEASEQSHRLKIMKVKNLKKWNDFLKESNDYDLKLYAYEAATTNDSFKHLLKNRNYHNVLVVIGPEGGISVNEVNDLVKYGFLPITLGPRILRTQVAPLYVLSALSYEWEAKE